MTTGTRKTNDFCWINMLTPEPAKAREFYRVLLGWTYVELPGVGHLVQVGGKNIGGLFDIVSPQTPEGTPPVIGVMVKVESADDAAAKAAKLGGKALPAFDIPGSGRMAVCFDPLGANIDVWQPGKNAGTDADSLQHGAPSWFETMTTDAGRAVKFYSEWFGWKSRLLPMPGHEYHVFELNGLPIAGAMKITPQMGPMPPNWITYFTVRDADKAVSEAQKLGAKICVPAQDIPNIGRFAGITSPQGVTFFVIQYKR